jgi:hypothetical protein
MTLLLRRIRVFAFTIGLVSLMYIGEAAGQKGMNPTHREVLGIQLGTASSEDVERALGSTAEVALPNNEETEICYVSSGPDRIILQFVIWSKPVEFRFFRGSHRDTASCRKSAKILPGLATSSGIRLGMSRERVMALLGRPTEVEGGKITYDLSYDRPMTPEEKKSVANDLAYKSVDSVGITAKIELEISQARVSKVDVTYSETW